MYLCDPYQAQSWDGLHAHESGLFGDHILPELKRHIGLLGKELAKLLDDQYASFLAISDLVLKNIFQDRLNSTMERPQSFLSGHEGWIHGWRQICWHCQDQVFILCDPSKSNAVKFL